MTESTSSEMGIKTTPNYADFYEASKNTVFLEPRLALEQFNKRLPQYYDPEKAHEAEQFQVLTSEALQRLTTNKSSELRFGDMNMIQSLAGYLSKSRAELGNKDQEKKATEDLLKSIGIYLEESYSRDRLQKRK